MYPDPDSYLGPDLEVIRMVFFLGGVFDSLVVRRTLEQVVSGVYDSVVVMSNPEEQ